MRLWTGAQRFAPSRLLLVLVLSVGTLLPAFPAAAIVGSSDLAHPGDYPYVGAAWLVYNCCDANGDPFLNPIPPDLPPGDNRVRTTGVLIAPNVFLTEGAQYRNGRRVAVTFQNPIERADFTNIYNPNNNPGGTTFEGYVFHMPGLNRDDQSTYAQFDLAVIVLDFPVPWAASGPFARLAAVGALDPTKKAKTQALTALSYGPNTNDPATWDFVRRSSSWETQKVQATSTQLKGDSPTYSVCDGDQGAPLVNKAGDVAALLYMGPKICQQNHVADGIRLDTPTVRQFLCNVGTAGYLDAAAIPNPNPVGPNPLGYPAISNPNVLTDTYCGESANARHHREHRPHQGKQGGHHHHDKHQH